MTQIENINQKVVNFLNALENDKFLQEYIDGLKDKEKEAALTGLVNFARSEFGFNAQEWKETIKQLKKDPLEGMQLFPEGYPGAISGVNSLDGRGGLKFVPPNLLDFD